MRRSALVWRSSILSRRRSIVRDLRTGDRSHSRAGSAEWTHFLAAMDTRGGDTPRSPMYPPSEERGKGVVSNGGRRRGGLEVTHVPSLR